MKIIKFLVQVQHNGMRMLKHIHNQIMCQHTKSSEQKGLSNYSIILKQRNLITFSLKTNAHLFLISILSLLWGSSS